MTDAWNRLGRFLIENFVQHGFAVAQVSVFGTGESNHCMDLMGHDERPASRAPLTGSGRRHDEWPCCCDREVI